MNLLFQNAALGWLAGLAAIPVALHLFARARPPRFLFSATEFLSRAVRNTLRVRRPKDWLLLLCRTLLAAALLLLFLRPVLYRGRLADPGTARHRVLIVDRTASMGWTEGGRSRFAAACAEAAQLLDGQGADDTANVVWLDAEPDAVFPEMGSNAGYLKTKLAEARVTNEAGDPAAAATLALNLLASAGGIREVIVISDFQDAQWKRARPDFPAGIQVTTLSVARDESPNGALAGLRTEPLLPVAGEAVQVIAEVANYSAAPRSRTVLFEIGEARPSRTVMVPAWGKASAVVEHVFPAGGPCPVQARLDEDAYGVDDWRGQVVPVRRALRVGLASYDASLGDIWARALRSMPWLDGTPVPPAALAEASGCDLLMLAGWDGAAPETLAALRDGGLPMVCAPAAGVALAALAKAAGAPAADGAVSWETLSTEVPLQIGTPDAPVFDLFKGGDFGDPATAAFRQRWKIPAGALPGEPWLEYADGAPAVLRCTGLTPFVIWTAPLAANSGTWASQRAFLPFFGELVGAVRSRRAGHLPPVVLAGERLDWLATLQSEKVRLVDSLGGEVPASPGPASPEGRVFVSEPVRQPGLYQWEADGSVQKAVAVNFPETESDLRFSAAPAGTGEAVRTAAEVRTLQEGLPLWPFLAWAALGLLALESVIVILAHLDARRLAGEGNG